jgi:hypothetical protein
VAAAAVAQKDITASESLGAVLALEWALVLVFSLVPLQILHTAVRLSAPWEGATKGHFLLGVWEGTSVRPYLGCAACWHGGVNEWGGYTWVRLEWEWRVERVDG